MAGIVVTLDTPRVERISRNYGMLTGAILFDSSYPTGGEDAGDISKYFKTILQLMIEQFGGYMFEYDKSGDLIIARVPVNVIADDDAQGANNTVLKSDSADVLEVSGSGAAFQVAGAEVLDTTDLSGITAAKFIAVGLL